MSRSEITVAIVAALTILTAVTFRLYEPDFWQHLVVGRAIWESRAIPATHAWSWPSYGAPDVTPSWAFRALVWPLWAAGGVGGLFVWRWVMTLGAFAIAWLAARRMGARGVAPIVAIVLCAMLFRERAQIRPESFAAVLLALTIAILESRRAGGRDRSLLLIPIAWLWANSHISFPLCAVVIGIYAVDDLVRASQEARGRRARWRLFVIAGAAIAIAFANPFGWRLVWQPFEYWLSTRHEPIFQTIGELSSADWRDSWWNGLALVAVGWPLAAIARARLARRIDLVEMTLFVAFCALGLSTQRFLGFFAIVAAPFLARDVADLARSRKRSLPPAARAIVASAACVAMLAPSLALPELRPAFGIDWRNYPVAACDAIEELGVRGQGFAPFYVAGYMLWRFAPDRDRLPFMDIHQTGSPRDRRLVAEVGVNPAAWRELDRAYHFDYLLLNRLFVPPHDRLLETIDADSTWALVFTDDVAALYVRRDGPLAAVARDEYRLVSGGAERIGAAAARITDSVTRAQLRAELERAAAKSHETAEARSLLATIAIVEGRWRDAETLLREALRIDPLTPRAHERLGLIALSEGRPRDALRELETESRRVSRPRGLDLRIGQTHHALGNDAAARKHYERELSRHPDHREAADSLRAAAARGAR